MTLNQNSNRSILKPENWTNDPLTRFFELSHQNRFATYHQAGDDKDKHLQLGMAFEEFWKNLSISIGDEIGGLLLRSTLLYKSSAELAFSTQIYPTAILSRSVLETTGYAALFSKEEDATQIWLNRNNSNTALDKCRKYFAKKRLQLALSSYHVDLGKAFDRQYERAIELGAHPNPAGIFLSSEEQNIGDKKILLHSALTDDQELIELGLQLSFECGMLTAGALTYMIPECPELVALSQRVVALLDRFVAD